MTECVHTHKSTSFLHLEFTELMEERQAHTFPEDSRERRPQAVVCTAMNKPMPTQLVISVAGVDEVMKKALEDAKAGHDAAVQCYACIMLQVIASSCAHSNNTVS